MKFDVTVDKRAQAVIDRKHCINCGRCRELCPTGATGEYQKTVACTEFFQEARELAAEISCTAGCPLAIMPQSIAALVKRGELRTAWELICSRTPLPWTTAQLCEGFCCDACKRGEYVDEAVNIPALERYIISRSPEIKHEYRPRHYQKAAVIGGGPAGIAAAHRLSELGYKVTIFEKDEALGGAMNWGIPEFRLDKDRMRNEIAAVISAGVEVRYGAEIGRSMLLRDIWDEGFDVCLLAVGASVSEEIDIPGAEGPMVYDGVAVMRRINGAAGRREPEVKLGDKIVVFGEERFAADISRALVRCGKAVICTTENDDIHLELSAEEIDIIRAEGIGFVTAAAPKQIIREDGNVKAVEFIRTKNDEDSSGRNNIRALKGSESNLFCDTVIYAAPRRSSTEDIIKAETYSSGKVRVNALHMTNKENVFACGDVTGESASVPEAIAAGLAAADEIDILLQRKPLDNIGNECFNAPEEETIYPANIPMIYRQQEHKITEHGMSERICSEDVLSILRNAGIEENMPVLIERDADAGSMRRIAVAGGGIAGIAAAVELAKAGMYPVIFEKMPELGGRYRWMATEKRIDRELLQSELSKVEAAGIQVEYCVAAGIRPDIGELFDAGFDAVLFAVGETAAKLPNLPGIRAKGVLDIVSVMNRLVNDEIIEEAGNRIAVVGDSEYAADAAAKLREYHEAVTLFVPGSKADLHERADTVDAMLRAGVNMVTGIKLLEVNETDGHVQSLRCRIAEGARVIDVPCDTVVFANAAVPDTKTIAVRNPGLDFDESGYPAIDDAMMTSEKNVFAIGDFDMSSAESGKAAARAIADYFGKACSSTGIRAENARDESELSEANAADAGEGFSAPAPVPLFKRRIGMGSTEIYETYEGTADSERGFVRGLEVLDRRSAGTEASRCMECGYHSANGSMCMGCGICARFCPVKAIDMIALSGNNAAEEVE